MIKQLLFLAIISLTLSACNISGSASKGPFKSGSTVSTSKLNNLAVPIASTTINTQVSNNQGRFSVNDIQWKGWTEITIEGQYFDEFNNTDSSETITLNSITRKDRRFDTANVHLFSHLAAARIKNRVDNGQNRFNAWRDTQTEIIQLFGLNQISRNIHRGVEQLDPARGSGHYRRDNANLLLFTGSFLASGGHAQSLQDITEDFADDAQFNGVGVNAFNAIAIAGNTSSLIETLAKNLINNGANNPPNSGDLQELPIWVNTDNGELDVTPPVIVITGMNPFELEVGNDYEDDGATVTDDTDISIDINTENGVTSSVLGSYDVVYTATDNAGNSTSETRVVNVVDTTLPSITLIGNNPDDIIVDNGEVPAPYQDPGANVTDNYDTEISYSADTSLVITSTVGTYTLIYTAIDSSGNEAEPIEREVNVIPAPFQILFETNPLEVLINTDSSVFTQDLLSVASIVDGNGDQIENEPTFDTASVDLSEVGEYPVLFTYTDPIERTITKTLTVNVVLPEDNIRPVITLLGDAIVNVIVGSDYEDAGATAEDDTDGVITLNIITENLVNTNSDPDTTFLITYNVKDAAGNDAVEVTRTVIIDPAPPSSPLVVLGAVMLADGTEIDNAEISVFQNSELQTEAATSDASGDYSIELQRDVDYVLLIKKDGFATQIKQLEAIDIPELRLDIIMIANGATESFTPEESFIGNGPSGASVELAANAIQGLIEDSVTVAITPLDTSNQDGIDALPGSNKAQFELQTELLTPFILGATEFTFTSTNSGLELDLAFNQTAIITIPLFHSQKGDGTSITAGEIFPLLFLNETTGNWEQEGTATVIEDVSSPTGFSAIATTVSHFSWWSVSLAGPTTVEAFVDVKFVESNPAIYADIKARTTAGYAFSDDLARLSGGETQSIPFPGYIEFKTCFWAEVYVNGGILQTFEQCIDEPSPTGDYDLRFYTPIDGTFHGNFTLWHDTPDITTGPLRTFEEAKTYCSQLNLGGRMDWVLPFAPDYSFNAETIEQAVYNTLEPDSFYWSLDTDGITALAVKGTVFNGGGNNFFAPYSISFSGRATSNRYGVRCVSNGLPN